MSTFHSMQPVKQTSTNRCSFCGATSYHRVVARDAEGVMRYTERLRCMGCTREFPSMKAWRGDIPEADAALVATP